MVLTSIEITHGTLLQVGITSLNCKSWNMECSVSKGPFIFYEVAGAGGI